MRGAGTDTNNHYAVIRDIKRPQNSNSSQITLNLVYIFTFRWKSN